MTDELDQLARALAAARPADAIRIHERMLAALLGPNTRADALAALWRGLDRASPSSSLAFYLGRYLLEDGDLEAFRRLASNPHVAARAGAVDSTWSSSAIPARTRREAMPIVYSALHDDAARVRARGCEAVKNASGLDLDLRPFLRRIVELLEDRDDEVRFSATWAVAVLGRRELDLTPLLPMLARRLQDAYEYTREAAASALKVAARRNIDIAACIPPLVRAAEQSDDKRLRSVAKGALAAASRGASRRPRRTKRARKA